MSVQRIVEDTPPIELQAEAQYDESEPPVCVCVCMYIPLSNVCVCDVCDVCDVRDVCNNVWCVCMYDMCFMIYN